MAVGEEIARMFVSVGGDIDGFEGSMNKVESRISSVSRSMLGSGTALTGLTAPLIGAAKTGVQQAMAYQSNMNMLEAVSDATEMQMLSLGATAQAMGEDLTLPGTSAGDAAEAMVELAKAGLSVEDVMGGVKGTLQLSAAGQISNAQAATITAGAMNAFNLEGSEAVRVADLLAASANSSAGSVASMADGLQMSASVYAAAGQPIEDLVTVISLLANAGIVGSDAGTSLKQMMLTLMSPSAAAAEALTKLGVDAWDAQGNMVPLVDIIGQLAQAKASMTTEKFDEAIAAAFGSDAARAAMVLAAEGAEGFSDMKGAVTEQGAAAELAAVQMEGLSGAIEGLGSQVETALLGVFEPLLTTMEGVVGFVTDLVTGFINLDEPTKAAILAFAGLVTAAGQFLLLAGAIGTALATILSPIGLVVIGIGALGAAFASDFMGIRTSVESIGQELGGAIEKTWNSAQPTIESVGQELGGVLDKVTSGYESVGQELGGVLDEVTSGYEEGGIGGAADSLGQNIADYITQGITYIQDNIGTWASDLGSAISDLVGQGMAFISDASGLATGIVGLFSEAINLAVTSWETYGPQLSGAIGQLLGALFGKGIRFAMQTLPNIMGNLAGSIVGIFSGGGASEAAKEVRFAMQTGGEVLKAGGGFVGSLAEWIVQNGERVGKAMKNLAVALLTGFATAFAANAPAEVVEVAETLLSEMKGAISAIAADPVGEFIKLGKAIIDGLIAGIEATAGQLAKAVTDVLMSGIPGPVKKFFNLSSPSKLMMGYGVDIMAGLQIGMEKEGARMNVPIPSMEAPDVAVTRLFTNKMTGADGGSVRSMGRQAMRIFIEGMAEEAPNGDVLSILAKAIHPAMARTSAIQRSRSVAR